MAVSTWNRSLKLLLDTSNPTNAILDERDQNGTVTVQRGRNIALFAGDEHELVLSFYDFATGTRKALPASSVVVVSGTAEDGTTLFISNSFSSDSGDPETLYTGDIDLTTTEISDLFDEITADSVTIYIQVEIQDASNTERKTLAFEATLVRDRYENSTPPGSASNAAGVFSGQLKMKSTDTGLWHTIVCRTVDGTTFISPDQTGTVSP